MSKKRELCDGYVRIDLRPAGKFGSFSMSSVTRSSKEIKDDLENLAEQARLRLDAMADNRGPIYVVKEYDETCEYCGSIWTEKSDEYNGGCCDKDEDQKR